MVSSHRKVENDVARESTRRRKLQGSCNWKRDATIDSRQDKKDTKKTPALGGREVGTVDLYNIRNGYGFVSCNNTGKNILIHQSAITWNNPQKKKRTAVEGQTVELIVVSCDEFPMAAEVTGLNGTSVHGSVQAPLQELLFL